MENACVLAGIFYCVVECDSDFWGVRVLCLRMVICLIRLITSRTEPLPAAISSVNSVSFKTTFISAATLWAIGILNPGRFSSSQF